MSALPPLNLLLPKLEKKTTKHHTIGARVDDATWEKFCALTAHCGGDKTQLLEDLIAQAYAHLPGVKGERVSMGDASVKPVPKERPRRQVAQIAIAPPSGSPVWDAYAAAYEARYRISPVRNARANALCKQLVQRLGTDAPAVARYFLDHPDRLYVNARHALPLLVRDAEKIHTDWRRGRAPTSLDAAAEEKHAGVRDQLERIRKGEL